MIPSRVVSQWGRLLLIAVLMFGIAPVFATTLPQASLKSDWIPNRHFAGPGLPAGDRVARNQPRAAGNQEPASRPWATTAQPPADALTGNQFREVGVPGAESLPQIQQSQRPAYQQPVEVLPFRLEHFPDAAVLAGDLQSQSPNSIDVPNSSSPASGEPSVPTAADPRLQAALVANPRRELIVENFDDGKPRLFRTVLLDKDGNYYNDGPWIVHNRAAQVVAEGTYDQGVMDGQWGRRHVSSEGGLFATKPFTLYQGPFDSIAFFKSGKLDGQWVIYDQLRRSIFEIGYRDGKRHGVATWFYPDRTKMREATFSDGVLDGEVLEWDESNRLVSRDLYRDGRKVIRNTSFYRPDQKSAEEFYLDVRMEPDGIDNWWEAKPAPYASSGRRVQNGPVGSWYSNRQLKHRGQYRDDHPIGQFTWWHENGNRKSLGGFNLDGLRNGRWLWWHSNGMKQVDGEYRNDVPVGVWRSWDEEGQLLKERDYGYPEESEPTTDGDPLQVDKPESIDPVDGDAGPPVGDLPLPIDAGGGDSGAGKPSDDPETEATATSEPGLPLEGIEPLDASSGSVDSDLLPVRPDAKLPVVAPKSTEPPQLELEGASNVPEKSVRATPVSVDPDTGDKSSARLPPQGFNRP